jgi:hypothetical protein
VRNLSRVPVRQSRSLWHTMLVLHRLKLKYGEEDVPSPETFSFSLSSCRTSSSLDIPDMKSSSESMLGLPAVRGVGGLAAEAIFFFGRDSNLTEDIAASAAFLFFDLGGMVPA